MNSLTQALQDFKNWASKTAVGSFVQNNPTPAGFAQRQLTPVAQKFVQSVQSAWSNPQPSPQQYAQQNIQNLQQRVAPAVAKFTSWVTNAGNQFNQQAQSSFNTQQSLQKQGIYSGYTITPSRAIVTDYQKQIQQMADKLPTFKWGVGNPIKPQGYDVNTGAIAKGALDLVTGGAYSPDEQSLLKKVNAGNTDFTPQELVAARNLQETDRLAIMGLTKTPEIQNALRGRIALTKTPEEAVIVYNEFADNLIKTGAKDDLQALRATLNKELVNLVGGSGNYKKDYAILQTMKNDSEVGGIIRTIEDKIFNIDKVLAQAPKIAEKRIPSAPIDLDPAWINESPTLSTNKLSPRLSPSRGLGLELARKGMTWDEIIKLTPPEGQKILLGRASFEDFMKQTPVKQKVNLLDYLRTPNRVLEKIGMGDEAKALRQQYDAYQMALPKEMDKITAWSKRAPTPDANERIFRFLDGEKNVTLTGEEGKVAQEIRQYLNDWAVKLNLPPRQRVSDYITRLYKLGTIEAEFDEDLAKLIDPKIAKSIYNPFLQHRVGQRIDYLKDTWQSLQAYTKRGTRKYYMDPVLERAAQKAESLPLESWKYVKSKISNINMRPEEIDTLVDNVIKSSPVGYRLGQRPIASVTRKARSLVFRGLLGLSPSSALRNLGQSSNTYAVLGERDFGIGVTKAALNLPKFLLNMDTELEAAGVLGKDIIQDRSLNAVKKFWEVADKEGFFRLFDLAEKWNRGVAYWGAKAQGIRRGMSEPQAIVYAKEIIAKTQFLYDALDTPVALQSDLVKTLFQFIKYPVAQTEFLYEMAVRDKNIAGSLRWVASTVLFWATVGKLYNADWKEMLPQYRFGTPPTLQLPWEAGKAALNVPNKYGVVSEEQNPIMRIIQSQGVQRGATNYFPAGSQIMKTYEGLKSYNKGESTTPTGNIRFPVEQTTPNLMRSALFGQYSTPQALTYFDTDARPLSAKQSELVRSSTDKSETYQQIMQKRADNAQITQAKDVIEKTGTPSYVGTTYVFIDSRTGDTKAIDTSFQPTVPTYTGNYELDKQIKSKFFSEITKKKGIIVDLYEQKQLTGNEAEKQLSALETLKASTGSGSSRASTGRKIAIRSMKVPSVKLAKTSSTRRLKLRMPKLTYIKPPTTRRLKVRAASVPKMRKLKLRSIASLQKQFLTMGKKNSLQISKSRLFV